MIGIGLYVVKDGDNLFGCFHSSTLSIAIGMESDADRPELINRVIGIIKDLPITDDIAVTFKKPMRRLFTPDELTELASKTTCNEEDKDLPSYSPYAVDVITLLDNGEFNTWEGVA